MPGPNRKRGCGSESIESVEFGCESASGVAGNVAKNPESPQWHRPAFRIMLPRTGISQAYSKSYG